MNVTIGPMECSGLTEYSSSENVNDVLPTHDTRTRGDGRSQIQRTDRQTVDRSDWNVPLPLHLEVAVVNFPAIVRT